MNNLEILKYNQKLAFEKLSKLKSGVLFMQMGTGKTKVALDLIKSRQADFDVVIWIAPASLIRERSYTFEIEKWSNGLNKPIKYFTVEGISQSDNKFLEMHNLAGKNRNFCVVDESIKIKNIGAIRTDRLLAMYDKFDFRLILNGTPTTRSLLDLYAQIQFISPSILNMTETQFADNYLQYYNEGFQPWKRWSRPENEQALIETIRPYIFDADLEIDNNINFIDNNFKLNKFEREQYKDFKEGYLHNKLGFNFLATAQTFQHFYTNSCAEKHNILCKTVNQILQRKEKVIIYVKFLDEIEDLRNIFDCVVFTGKEKKDAIEQFRNNKNVLISTYGVGSFGLNLQFCNNIIYYSQTFDYKDKEQSLHRVYRTGQKKDVNIYNFWIDTGLDEIIKSSLKNKKNLLDNVKKIISKEEAMKL